MDRLNGQILSRDRTIAAIGDGFITHADQALLPLYLARTGDVEGWLKSRAIDGHRTNSRLLKKALRLTAADDVKLVRTVNAVTITDTYWFREADSPLTFEDVRFKKNLFDKLALKGDPDSFNQPYSPTPELTNIGSFEKCWRLENGTWWMLKQGNALERFSELLICRLGQRLGFPMAHYQEEDDMIKSPDFTKGASVNYEPAFGLVGEDEDYILNFRVFWELAPEIARQYLEIIYLDTLCFNMDRHTYNYGLLRDVESGAILSMAPNFDNNIALFARGIPRNTARQGDRLIALFCQLLEQDRRALGCAKSLSIPTEKMLYDCMEGMSLPVDPRLAVDFVITGSNIIQNYTKNL